MTEIGIGIIGGGYMGKAHAVAHSAVGAVFGTRLRPRLEMIAASSPASAERYRESFGFRRAAASWQELVEDPQVGAVVIASPPETHLAITEAAAERGKAVFCEKPLGSSISDGRAIVTLGRRLARSCSNRSVRTSPSSPGCCSTSRSRQVA